MSIMFCTYRMSLQDIIDIYDLCMYFGHYINSVSCYCCKNIDCNDSRTKAYEMVDTKLFDDIYIILEIDYQ